MPTAVIGLDIGHRTLRAVSLRRRAGRLEVVATAAVSRLLPGEAEGEEGQPKSLEVALAELDARLPLRGPLVVGASEIQTLVRFVPTAPLPPERLARLLRLELQQQGDSTELAADYVTLTAADELIHCCAIAQPTQVYSLLLDCRAAKVEPVEVGFAPVSLANAAMVLPGAPPAEAAPRPVSGDQLGLIVDIGANGSSATLFGEDRFLACRLLPVGGETFTENVVATARVGRAKAEAMKLAGETTQVRAVPKTTIPEDDPFGLLLDQAVEGPGTETIAVGNQSLGPELSKAAEGLYTQIAASLTWFKAQAKLKDPKPAKVLLCGGGAGLDGLAAYLARRCECPVERWDPFTGVHLVGAAPERPWEYAAALGLALGGLKNLGARAIGFDLRPDGLLRKEAMRQRVVWPWLAAGLSAAALVVGGWVLHLRQSAFAQTIANHQDAQKAYDQARARLKALDQERDALSEDLRAIASRIYAARDYLNVLRALKEQAVNAHEIWVVRAATESASEDKSGKVKAIEGTATDASKAKWSDSAIDRGAVRITCRVKFEVVPNSEQIRQFADAYYNKMREWTPDPQVRRPPPNGFLRDSQWGNIDINQKGLGEKTKPLGELGVLTSTPKGDAEFWFRIFFEPTSLDQTLTVRPAEGAR